MLLLSPALMSQDYTYRKAIGLTASLPWINNYSYYSYDLQKRASKSGFMGLGGAVFYQTKENKFSLNYGFTGSLPAPMGPIDFGKDAPRTNIISNFFEGLFHRRLSDRISLIGGLNLVKYRFDFISNADSIPNYSMYDDTFGLTIGGQYHFTEVFSLALFYRPAFINENMKIYRHLVSLDARFDINLWKRN